jgi:hypothetical protein
MIPSRTVDRSSRQTGASRPTDGPSRKVTTVFVELNTRTNDGFTVSLEWDRHSGHTQIVIDDARTRDQIVFAVPGAKAADAFRHPFRYVP